MGGKTHKIEIKPHSSTQGSFFGVYRRFVSSSFVIFSLSKHSEKEASKNNFERGEGRERRGYPASLVDSAIVPQH